MGDPQLVLAEFRAALVLVPQTGPGGPVWTGDQGGIRWIHAFTDESELVAFARARGQQSGAVDYLTVRGSRLLDVGVAAVGVPAGVALNAAGSMPMLFPPVRGIVPDTVALDGAGAR
ncbi:SseB family protein [Kitasatospora sp. NPDC051853]|uniref:SseB family protein n=1 Tax=Kitasatospora sp. NPDC051853 TaxID=3364058 RepID=UPI00378B8189